MITFKNSVHSWILLWLKSRDFRTFSKLYQRKEKRFFPVRSTTEHDRNRCISEAHYRLIEAGDGVVAEVQRVKLQPRQGGAQISSAQRQQLL